MEKAFSNDVFAVVDLETTGTQRQNEDRIIQFGCAIIKHRRVVKTYSFLINPQKEIPQSVENLTGITNDDVAQAPVFSHFAKEIRDILKDAIFVAHNVNFDLPFLNYELTRAGLEPLSGKALDTVELSQIAFPTYPSYKLRDLTSRLNIKHLNPHRADSDALVTAKLLLKIISKLEELPQATLNTLTALSKGLLRNTDYIFSEISKSARQKKRPLSRDLIQIRNLIIKKTNIIIGNPTAKEAAFPESDIDKKKLFKGHIRFRRGQVSLINKIHEFLSSSKKESLVVEAPNGSGKTFSFLMSYAYELYSGRKLVIATPTKVLQEQMLSQEIPQLIEVTGLDLIAQEVKSSSHYIDLDGFYNSLYQSNQGIQTLILQMKILVWLTETTTGDLDELQLTNYQDPLFTMIRHPGDARVGTLFSEYDFWNLARERQEEADILITNHAYLANHYMDSIWGQNPFLVVDEAHRFVDNVTTSRSNSIQFESFWGMCSHLKNLLFFSNYGVKVRFGDDQRLSSILDKLDSQILDLIHAINEIQRQLFSRLDFATSSEQKTKIKYEYGFQGEDLFPSSEKMIYLLNQLQNKIEIVRRNVNQILFLLYHEQGQLMTSDDALIKELQDGIDQLDFYSEQNYLLMDQLNSSTKFLQMGFILQITNIEDPLSTNLSWLMINPSDELMQLYEYFSKKLFISATLMEQDDFSYILKVLCLDPTTTITYKGKASYQVEKHLQVLALEDSNVPTNPNEDDFSEFIIQFLKTSLGGLSHILVLFTNLETIKTVFTQISTSNELKDYEILAQGLTGTNERIAKRFSIAKKTILLGANSFWEGIDFKNSGVDLAIVTKLPFESPDQPEVKLRDERLKKQVGSHVFELDTLPRAIIRFRQGCGRLIRNERDHGIFVILDQRVWHKDYGQKFLNSLPVSAKKVNLENLKALLKDNIINESKS
ncbi:ATP-dependent DNA helicase DinG [Lactobacillus colini]|uniref:3'-5' exonuclease DinG n=1 Tax=Lactobacillus colini TaxID=1819254 RepID=A0ABS4MBP6_9LACO|nr:ATP-dependent DNA helicase DinG [Lactobacillus colini]